MAAGGTTGNRLSAVARTAVDALAYASLVAVLALVGSGVVAVATGGGLVRAKWVLFILGWLLVALATARLWPSSPDGDDRWTQSASGGTARRRRQRSRLERAAGRLPPLRWLPEPAVRLSPAAKQFVAALCLLLVSFLLEAVFAVG